MMQLFNMDCIKGMCGLEENSVDLIVTSPPYFNAKSYSHWETYESYLAFLTDVFTKAFRCLKPGRMACVNLSVVIEPRKSRQDESQRLPIPFHFVPLMESIGYKFIEDIIWVKPDGASKNRNGGFFRHRTPVAYKPNIINEYILVFQKPMDGLIDDIIRAYPKTVVDDSKVPNGYESTNIWRINPDTKNPHPAPYPEKLAFNLITYYSFKGDTVLDPFMGSGTTAVVCKDCDRRFVGYEKDPQYFELSQNRLRGLELILEKDNDTPKCHLW